MRRTAMTLAISVTLFLFFTYFGYMRFETLSMSACGIGIYLQSLYNVCQGKPFFNTINGNLLAWRFEPILVILAPIFCLFKSPLVVISSQSLALSLAIPLMYYLERKVLGKSYYFTLALALSPIFLGLGLYDFSTIALSLPLLLLTLISIENRSLIGFFISSILYLMTSSISGIILISIGFFLSTVFRDERRLWGNLLMLLGTLGLLTSVIIMEKVNPDWLWYKMSHIDPFFGRRAIIILIILVGLSFLPLLTIEGFIALIPIIVISLMYKNVPYFFIGTYMPAPMFFNALVLSLYTAKVLKSERILKLVPLATLITLILFNPLYPTLGKLDFVVYYAFPKVEEHQILLRKVLESLPKEPTLLQSNLFAYLYYRDDIYLDYKPGVKVVVLDSSSIWYPFAASVILLKERFRNACEMFETPISQTVKLLSNPKPFVESYEREFKVDFAFDNIVVASRGKVRLNVKPPTGINATFYKDVNFKEVGLRMGFFRMFLDWKTWSPYITIPADKFSAVFRGKITLNGTYEFFTISDDGILMKIGNNLVFNCLRRGPCFDFNYLTFKNDTYMFEVKYVEYIGNSMVKIYYKKAGWKRYAYLNSTVNG